MSEAEARTWVGRTVTLQWRGGKAQTVTPLGIIHEGGWGAYFVLDDGRRWRISALSVVEGPAEGDGGFL